MRYLQILIMIGARAAGHAYIMKYGILYAALSCTSLFFASHAQAANSNNAIIAEKNYAIGSFDNVQIEGDIIVNITTRKGPSARATGPRKLLNLVQLSNNSRTLKIQLKSHNGTTRRSETFNEPLEIFITTQKITDIDINGNGNVNIDNIDIRKSRFKILGSGRISVQKANINDLEILIWGGGNVNLQSGNVVKSNFAINGFGSIIAENLVTETLDISHIGPANSIINVSNVAHISNNGTGQIEIIGKGNCLIKSIGSARIICPDNNISNR